MNKQTQGLMTSDCEALWVIRKSQVAILEGFRVALDWKWVIRSATLSQVSKFNLLKRMQLQSWVEVVW